MVSTLFLQSCNWVSFRGAWLVTLPLLRFFNEWGGWGHPSAASSLHIHYLLPEVLQADTLHNSTPELLKLSNTEIQFRINWSFWSIQWLIQMSVYLPAYELLPNHFLRELWKFVSWVCYKVHCQTIWVFGLNWIQNLAIAKVLLHTHLFLRTFMNYKEKWDTQKKPLS